MDIEDRLRLEEDDGGGEEEAPAWIASYSDMMTDLLAIFVILFSFAMLAQSHTNARANSALELEGGKRIAIEELHDLGEGEAAPPPEDRLLESIREYIQREGLADRLQVGKQADSTLLLRMSDFALFDSGKADIDGEAEGILAGISGILAAYDPYIHMVRIEGHTDDRPINTRQFNSNWELSTSRAVNVLKWLLEDSPLGPTRFSAVGYSEFYPVAGNDTPEGRAQNRRVDFIIQTRPGPEEAPQTDALP